MLSYRSGILVMLSGGLDSTAILVKTLTETDAPVAVHHIHLMTSEERYEAERFAVSRIVQYCRTHYRDFEYSESRIDVRELNLMGDYYHVAYMAVNAVNTYKGCGEVRIGWTVTCNQPRRLRQVDLFNRLLQEHFISPYEVKIVHPLKNMTKSEILACVPRELADLTIPCRQPVKRDDEYISCGKCITCDQVRTTGWRL